jgi:predicted transcriptional regulator
MAVISTSVKLPAELKARIHKLAELSHRSPHSIMLEALTRGVDREERLHAFVQEAIQSDKEIEEGGNIYRAEDVHSWLKRLASGNTTERPKPWHR